MLQLKLHPELQRGNIGKRNRETWREIQWKGNERIYMLNFFKSIRKFTMQVGLIFRFLYFNFGSE